MLSPTSQACADVRQYQAERARIRAASEAFEAEAQAIAAKCGNDVAHLSYELDRVSFGSRSHSWDAAHERRVLFRALQIAGAAHAA